MQCTMRSRIIVQCTRKRVSSGCCFILKTDAPEIDILYDDTRSLTGKPSHHFASASCGGDLGY